MLVPAHRKPGTKCFNMEYTHLKDKHGFRIDGWMVREYHLTGNELFVFGLVFSLSQGRAGRYTGGIPFMCEFFGWASNTCRKHLRALVDRGLLVEYRGDMDGVPFCYYSVPDWIMDAHPSKNEGYTQNFEGYPSKNEVSPVQNLHPDTLQNLKANDKRIETKKETIIPPTPQAVAEYCRGRGFADPEGFADLFLENCNNNGWRMHNGEGNPITNWKNYIINSWERNHKGKTYPRAAATPSKPISKETLKAILR